MTETNLELQRLYDVEDSLKFDWNHCMQQLGCEDISDETAERLLNKLILKIKYTLDNPSYTTEDEYFKMLLNNRAKGSEAYDDNHYTMDIGYLMRCRLECLIRAINLDIFQIQIERQHRKANQDLKEKMQKN